jgi:hypothetical protein
MAIESSFRMIPFSQGFSGYGMAGKLNVDGGMGRGATGHTKITEFTEATDVGVRWNED